MNLFEWVGTNNGHNVQTNLAGWRVWSGSWTPGIPPVTGTGSWVAASSYPVAGDYVLFPDVSSKFSATQGIIADGVTSALVGTANGTINCGFGTTAVGQTGSVTILGSQNLSPGFLQACYMPVVHNGSNSLGGGAFYHTVDARGYTGIVAPINGNSNFIGTQLITGTSYSTMWSLSANTQQALSSVTFDGPSYWASVGDAGAFTMGGSFYGTPSFAGAVESTGPVLYGDAIIDGTDFASINTPVVGASVARLIFVSGGATISTWYATQGVTIPPGGTFRGAFG